MLEDANNMLASHAGERVEVTGTVDRAASSQSSPRSGDADASTTAGATASGAASASAERLRVVSVRTVASNCSAR
jgi:hypothetical protein